MWQYTPMFAHLLHIRPWEIGRLTATQFDDCVAWIDNYLAPPEPKNDDDPESFDFDAMDDTEADAAWAKVRAGA